jgi:hypothetical protein
MRVEWWEDGDCFEGFFPSRATIRLAYIGHRQMASSRDRAAQRSFQRNVGTTWQKHGTSTALRRRGRDAWHGAVEQGSIESNRFSLWSDVPKKNRKWHWVAMKSMMNLVSSNTIKTKIVSQARDGTLAQPSQSAGSHPGKQRIPADRRP